MIGLVAYSLYKQHKRDWLKKHHEEHGVEPDDKELGAFLRGVGLPNQLSLFRKVAEETVVAYSNELVELQRPEIAKAAIPDRIEELANRIEKSSRLRKQIPVGVATAVSYTLLLIAIAVILRFAGIDFLSVLAAAQPGS